jgi:tetratricopeptide (TPR) repeat protein
MAEMKSAWEDYVQKDKNKYKPQFSFDDLATFDRALYNYIGNPLVLRLFLETYHNKVLPKKGNKHLNIWADWLATFSDDEQEFFKLLADAIWEKGENELLLDDVLKNENLNPYFKDDRINAPYPRLKNNGWISCYVKDLNVCVAFTVEGALLFIFGKQLQNRAKEISIELIDEIFVQGLKLQKAGFVAFLCEEAMLGELDLITKLIDEGGDKLEICIRPLLHYLKAFGVEDTLSKLLQDTTENDWQALLKLNKMLNELQFQVLRKELLYKAIEHIEFSNKYDTEFGLIAISAIDDEQARIYYAKIDGKADFLQHETQLLFELGKCEERFARYDNALEYYQKGLNIELNTFGSEHLYVANSYSFIGKVWSLKGEYDKALEFLYKCHEIQIKAFGEKHSSLATTYSIIGVVWDNKGEYDKSLELYQMSLDSNLTTFGSEHPSVAQSYNCIGSIFQRKGEYVNALEFFQKSLDICLNIFGLESPLVSIIYNNIGSTWKDKGEYDKALSFFQSCLKIQKKMYGAESPIVANTYNNIGVTFHSKGEHDKALEFFLSCLDIQLKTLGFDHPDLGTTYNNIGEVWRNKEEYDKALDYYQKSLDIQLKSFGEEHPSVGFLYGNFGRVWNDKGEIEKALDFFKKSLEIQLKVLGEEHPSVGELYGEIGMIKLMNGEIDVAIDYYHKYIDIQMKTLGEEHLSVGNLYDVIAMMHLFNLFNFETNISFSGDNLQQYSNECDKVIDYYQKSLSIKLINLGVENPELIPTYNCISSAYLKKGDNNKALEFYMKCLDIQIKTLGGEHLDVGTTYWNIGCCFHDMKEYSSAIKAFNNGYKIQRRGGYPFRIASCHEELGNKQEALDYFLQSAEIRKDDPEIGLLDEAAIESIENTKRIAKELGQENELPEWIINLQ